MGTLCHTLSYRNTAWHATQHVMTRRTQDRQRAASPMAHLSTTQHVTRLIHDKTHTFLACTQQAPAQDLLSPLELIPVSGPPPGNQTSGRRGARPPGGKDGTLLRRGYRVSPQLSLPGGAEMPWGSCTTPALFTILSWLTHSQDSEHCCGHAFNRTLWLLSMWILFLENTKLKVV